MSFFSQVELLPEDQILGLPALFAADPRPNKVNLGIGAYKDGEGLPQVLSSVRKAENLLLQNKTNKEYLPIEGDPEFLKLGTQLLFGKNNPLLTSGEIFASQAIGGSGALRTGGELLTKLISKTIFLPEPSWPNHRQIFEKSGFKLESYPYYDSKTNQLDFAGFCAAIKAMPSGSVILLHGCCHNPSGIDPTEEQWRELSTLIKKQKLFPFFDIAYQGFGKGLDEDAYAIRYFASEGHEMAIAYSFAKNFGLYNERVGILIIKSAAANVKAVASQIKYLIRCNYSTPPAHGARIVATILKSPDLTAEWKAELTLMRERIRDMRQMLFSKLQMKEPNPHYSSLLQQSGLFSFLGLTSEQVLRLRKDKGIYMPESGRLNIAGLNKNNIDYAVEAILAAMSD
jgi:aspartate/tyrosine/aromatic aminotransferase